MSELPPQSELQVIYGRAMYAKFPITICQGDCVLFEAGRDEYLARITLEGSQRRVLRIRRASLGLVPQPGVPHD